MTPLCDIEIREVAMTPKQRALARNSYVAQFEFQFSNWVDIARVCIEIDRDRDWELLGYHSFGDWMVKTAPRSRAYLYLVMGRYRELIADIPEEELAQIPLGSAGVLKQLSSKIRREPEVRKAAKRKPSELRQKIKEAHPEQLIEGLDARTLNFTESQAAVFDEMLAAYRAFNNHEATAEEAMEYLCANWLDSAFTDDPAGISLSNRQRASQLAETV